MKAKIKRGVGTIYSVLVRAQDHRRGYFETIVYALVLLSAVAAILQFSLQYNPLPLVVLPGSGVSA
jgi:ABC-type sugar transport system permease subunit